MLNKKLTIFVVLLAVLVPIAGVFLYSAFSSAQGEENSTPVIDESFVQEIPPLVTIKTHEGLSSESSNSGFINIRGKIVSDGNVKLTAPVAATVKEVLFAQGHLVKSGDVLLRLGGNDDTSHNLELTYDQAVINQGNIKKALQNTQNSTGVMVKQAEQQVHTLETSLQQLNTTLQLTTNAGNYTVQGAEIGLNNLQGALTRSQNLRTSNSTLLDLTGDQAQELAVTQVKNTVLGLLTTLKGAYEPLITGIGDMLDDDDFHDFSNEVDDIIDELEGYQDISRSRVRDHLGSVSSVLYDLLTLNEAVAESVADLDDVQVKPLATSLTQVSGSLTGSVSVAITQLSVTKNQLETLPSTTSIQLQNLDAQIAGVSDQLRSLQNTADQVRNASALQVQGISAQIQGLRQQKVSANLAVEAARLAAKSQMDTLLGQLNIVDKQVEQAKNALNQLEVVSPIDGYIVDVPVNSGEDVAVGRELVTVYATNVLFVRASIAPSDRDSIALDDTADLSLNASGVTGKVGAKIIRIAPVADPSGQIPVDLAFLSEDLPLAFVPGITVQGQLTRSSGGEPAVGVVSVPLNAVKLDAGKAYVYVHENGRAVLREVVLGPSTADEIIITSGVTLFDEIIVSDIASLRDGLAVIIADE